MKFDIRNRHTDAVMFTAEIECADDDSHSFKLGLAVKAAVKAGVDLQGADLHGAYLGDVDQITSIVARATRSDGYEFFGLELASGGIFIRAGCRSMTLAEYRAHIAAEYPDTSKARETTDILDFIAKRAEARP